MASSGRVLSWLWLFEEIPWLWCWDYTWHVWKAGTTTIRIKKDRSSSSACALAFFLHAAVFHWRVFNFQVRLAVVFGRSFTSLDDDDNSFGCVCWLVFLFKSLIHRIFWNLCLCANEKHFLELLSCSSCLSLCSLLLYLKCPVLVNHDALL